MSEKVKVSKEVAESIERARSTWASPAYIVKQMAKNEVFSAAFDALNTLTLDELIIAFYIGYEVEQTPEDKVREYYQQAKSDMQSTDYDINYPGRERVEAISYILEALNIKIEGVNA